MRATQAFQAPTQISASELIELMLHGSDPAILDLRTWDEYCRGHVPGSLSVPFDDLMAALDEFSSRASGFVFVCQKGDLSELARQHVTDDGQAPGTVLVGGYDQWVEVGGDIDVIPLPWPLERQIRFVAGMVVVTGLLLGMWHPAARWIVGGLGCALMFSGISGFCGLGNLLLRAPANRRPAPSVPDVIAELDRREMTRAS